MGDDITGFGYRQELSRSLRGFSSFAAGFSFVSILTTAFQLFGIGFSFGGSRFFWTWPVVFAGQMLVALTFSEMASRYPLAGSIYQWAKQVGGELVGWLAGWLMLIGCIVAFGAAAIALQVVLPSVWSGFQIVGEDQSITSSSGATNAILLGCILITCTTIVNIAGIRAVARVNDVGVVAELGGLAILLVGLAFAAVRGPGVVVENHHAAGTPLGISGLFMAALMPAYVLYGFDNAASVAEETTAARRTAPRAMLRAIGASGVIGLLIIILALMAAPSLTDGKLGVEGLPYVISNTFGGTLGKFLLADVALAVAACTLAIQTGAIRLFYAMGRDNALPFSRALSRVNQRTSSPIYPALISGVLAIATLLVNLGNPTLFAVLTGTSVVVVYLAYLMVTMPMLLCRLRGDFNHRQSEFFSLGRMGIPVNAAAVGYGIFMAVNIAWPRSEIYDPSKSGHWWSLLFPLEFIVIALIIGWIVRFATFRTRNGRVSTLESIPVQSGVE
ncbi:amino acid permease [Streptomyces sp. NPDC002285]